MLMATLLVLVAGSSGTFAQQPPPRRRRHPDSRPAADAAVAAPEPPGPERRAARSTAADDAVHRGVAGRAVQLLPRAGAERSRRQGNQEDRARDDEDGRSAQLDLLRRQAARQLRVVPQRPQPAGADGPARDRDDPEQAAAAAAGRGGRGPGGRAGRARRHRRAVRRGAGPGRGAGRRNRPVPTETVDQILAKYVQALGGAQAARRTPRPA